MKKLMLLATLIPSIAFAQTRELEVSVVTDYPTVLTYGASTEAIIRKAVADAGVTFKNQLDLDVKLVYVDIPTSQTNDQISKDSSPFFLLDQLATYRSDNASHRNADVTVLMTVRKLFVGSSVYAGMANAQRICSSQSLAVVQLRTNEVLDAQNFAHEVAHVLGADHDGDQNGTCGNEPSRGYLMSPVMGTGVELFSTCSVKTINYTIDLIADCITGPKVVEPTLRAGSVEYADEGGGGSIDLFTVALLVLALGYTLRRKLTSR